MVAWPKLDTTARRKMSSTAAAGARRLEPRLNAFVTFEDGLPPGDGKLGGLPYAAKDIFRTASHRPTGGFALPTDLAIEGETDLLARLDGAGARRVGFTGLPELAYEPSGYNHARGRVRNPWNLDFVAGGSSSGSAAAVASGSAVIALGSDTAGSLRIPAHCCGVSAWKPTYGIVACAGTMPLAPSLDTIGLLARSACDMRDAVHILIGDHQPRAGGSIARITTIADCFDAAEPSVRRACLQGADAIEATGVRVEQRTALAEIEAVGAHALVVLQAEAARVHRAQASRERARHRRCDACHKPLVARDPFARFHGAYLRRVRCHHSAGHADPRATRRRDRSGFGQVLGCHALRAQPLHAIRQSAGLSGRRDPRGFR